MTQRLVALDLAAGPAFVDALTTVWERGDAAFPLDRRLPLPARTKVLDRMAPGSVVDADGEHALEGGRPVERGDALVIATSGTTGEPKGVILTHDAVRASADATSRRLGVTADDHWLACLPLAHVGGLSVITRAIHRGTRLTVLPGFDPVAVEAAGATLVSLVPTALARVHAERFRTIVLGGSRPPDELPANVVTTYGMTETGSGVVYDGTPLDGVDVRIVAGEIQLRGPMLLRGLRDGSSPLLDGGWLPTGDLGHVDDDGRLHVEGRRAELIITGGENVWPSAVETALLEHPAVADVAVTGTDDAEWGQVVTAHVVARGEPPTLAELRRHVGETLPAFCAPRRLVLVTQLPRTALGKVERARLADGTG